MSVTLVTIQSLISILNADAPRNVLFMLVTAATSQLVRFPLKLVASSNVWSRVVTPDTSHALMSALNVCEDEQYMLVNKKEMSDTSVVPHAAMWP
jgi:hypothetical protein